MSESLIQSDVMFNFVLATPETTPWPTCIGLCLSLGQHRWRADDVYKRVMMSIYTESWNEKTGNGLAAGEKRARREESNTTTSMQSVSHAFVSVETFTPVKACSAITDATEA